jgi:signal peptidase
LAEIEKLAKIWKNEYFQAVLLTVAMIAIVFGFWFGSQFALRTQYPALAVVSGSMLPTLNVGDVIIVQGVPASEIRANYSTGDIVVYRRSDGILIVHRVVYKVQNSDGNWTITVKGDNNAIADSPFLESHLVGKVVARIPYIGNVALFVNALGSFYYFIIVLIIIVNILLSLIPSGDKEKENNEKAIRKKRKLFGKLSLEMFFFILVNALLVCFLIFNLFGNFTFWQSGAEPPDYVTIRGMYSDLQYQASYGEAFPLRSYNNVTDAFLSQGFMTYQIDDFVNGDVRLGVPAFSWVQASIVALFLFDFWILAKFLHLDKKIMQMLRHN